MTEELTKVCSKCGRKLPLSEFRKCKRNKDGLQVYCRECLKEYYRTHIEELSKKMKEYYENNSSDLLKKHHKYHKCVTNPSCPRVGGRGAEFETFTCEICGKEFRRSKTQVDYDYERRGYLPRYCSNDCKNEANRKTHKSKYMKEIERIKKEVG
ncbi:MAG: hypothetical protein WC248_05550 [Candidatus Methanomethylophilaceae archaeon]|jgi:hypothetical protein